MLTQFQGFIVKLIAYGGDLWELYLRLLGRAESFFHLQSGMGWLIISLYLLIVSLVGLTGGIFGYRLGRTALRIQSEDDGKTKKTI